MVKLARKIQKISHVLAIYLPKAIATELNIKQADTIYIELVDGKIVLEKVV